MGIEVNQPRDQWTPRKYTGLVGGQASMTFPNGVIMKWGINPAGDSSVAFGTAFPTACESITVTRERSAVVDSAVNISSPSTSGFTLQNNASGKVHWMAIGY